MCWFGFLLSSHDQKFESHCFTGGRQVNSSVQQSVVVMIIVVKSQCYRDSVNKVPRKQKWQKGFIFPVNLYWLPVVQCWKGFWGFFQGRWEGRLWSDSSICRGLGRRSRGSDLVCIWPLCRESGLLPVNSAPSPMIYGAQTVSVALWSAVGILEELWLALVEFTF